MSFLSDRALAKKQKICAHKYKDFPWYIKRTRKAGFFGYRYKVELINPYICCKCHKRLDKVLDQQIFDFGSEADSYISTLKERYHAPALLDRAAVENMINDYLYTDESYTSLYDELSK